MCVAKCTEGLQVIRGTWLCFCCHTEQGLLGLQYGMKDTDFSVLLQLFNVNKQTKAGSFFNQSCMLALSSKGMIQFLQEGLVVIVN